MKLEPASGSYDTLHVWLDRDELKSFGEAGAAYTRIVDLVDEVKAQIAIINAGPGSWVDVGKAVAVVLGKR